ncbi:MAG: urate hydroxylase PuuD [Myxococcota bacterium]|nr:urate hydroxylase PuuD [Myxococcota bacterium]
MDLVTTMYGWEFLLRYVHFLAGITWIGVLYYFNFIQTPFFGTELGGQAKGLMTRGLVPNALWWFRWGAMFTFLSGWLIVGIKMGAGIGLADPYMTRILTGGVMGTIMWFNVWFIIWPAQRDYAIKSAEQVAAGGEPVPGTPEKGALAGRASRTNTLFSIPMLFFMGSASHLQNHLTGANDMIYWIIALALMAAVELNAVIGTGARQKYLATVSGTIHTGLGLTLVLFIVGRLVNTL